MGLRRITDSATRTDHGLRWHRLLCDEAGAAVAIAKHAANDRMPSAQRRHLAATPLIVVSAERRARARTR